MIIDTLIILLFGFPGAILSLLVSAIGIIKDKYWLPLIGALLFMPFYLLFERFASSWWYCYAPAALSNWFGGGCVS